MLINENIDSNQLYVRAAVLIRFLEIYQQLSAQSNSVLWQRYRTRSARIYRYMAKLESKSDFNKDKIPQLYESYRATKTINNKTLYKLLALDN